MPSRPPLPFSRNAICQADSDFQGCGIETSSSTGQGLSELAGGIRRAVSEVNAGHFVAGTAERCDESLRSTAKALSRTFELSQRQGGEELIAAELRLGAQRTGESCWGHLY